MGLVGVVLTLLVTTVLTQIEGVRQRNLAQEELINQRPLESQRAEAAAEVAEQQAQQEALQTYLGDMGELILRDTSPLPEASPDDAVSELARAKTLTVLGGVDAQSMGIVLQFLAEARLIHSGEEKEPIITLSGADLSGAYLRDADLSGADLSNAQVVTQGQLKQQAVTLEGATMPDGSEHP
jgi:uncharacterized protein YjbI with pentapeptide repeats